MTQHDPNRYSFYYKGKDKGILLIHGITGTPSEMHYLGIALNKAGFSVMCNTLPRHCGTLAELKKVTWQEIVNACSEDLKKIKQDCSQVFVGGISMGALVAIYLAYKFPSQITGIIAFAPTLFYDGWALHKGKALLDLIWHLPFVRNNLNIREGWPYGLKDEKLRENIHRFYKDAKANHFDNKIVLFGSPFFPAACLYQHQLFAKVVKDELKEVKNPILILHAREDDMTSLKNAHYILSHIGSKDKSLIVLEDSYHMITIDKEKDRVVQEVVGFIDKH
jgi:carboxylesterase